MATNYNVDADLQRALWWKKKKQVKEQHKIVAIPSFKIGIGSNECQQSAATDVINYISHAVTWHLNRVSKSFFSDIV